MTYKQVFDPVGASLLWSALVALIPIAFFFWALAIKRMKGYAAGFITLTIAFAAAVLFYRMPAATAAMSAVQGAVYGLLPIAWVIIPSVLLYKLSVKSGQFDTIRASIVSITEDRRLQALLVAFSFGSFLEGAAGFGAPVAICAALLVGLGFSPLMAAGVCLVANTAPVAFGAIGIPILALEGPTGISALTISSMVGRQLPLLAIVIPYYFVVLMAGFRKANEVLPAILVSGISFAAAQFAAANFIGPELPDILAALVSLVALALFLQVWRPKTVFRFDEAGAQLAAAATADAAPRRKRSSKGAKGEGRHSAAAIFKAWSPYVLLTALISVWGVPVIKLALGGGYEGASALLRFVNMFGHALTFHPTVPWLHNVVIDDAGKPMPAYFKLDFLSAAGTAIFITSLITKAIYGVSWRTWIQALAETVNELKFSILTIMSVIGFAYIANYSGMSTTLGRTLSLTGVFFPFFSPLLGWLGVFITGSDTSANLLFGNLQKVTAQSVGMNPVLAIAANTSGGGCAKMISPQSIAIASAAVGLNGRESELFRFTFKHSVLLVIVIGILTYLQTTILAWMVPSP